MLDKFIGDALMAAFGIPVGHEDDPDRAVRAAVSMINALDELNRLRVSRGQQPIQMGIGLNTDIIVSGNIGSPKRMDYTVIGDGVNLASRLESACKEYSARILASAGTVKKLKGSFRMREIDLVIVKGKTEPVAVHEVLDYHTDETFPHLMDVVNDFRDGVASYRRGAWDAAIGNRSGGTRTWVAGWSANWSGQEPTVSTGRTWTTGWNGLRQWRRDPPPEPYEHERWRPICWYCYMEGHDRKACQELMQYEVAWLEE